MKEDGSAVGLAENAAELTRWMIYGPKISRIVTTISKGTCVVLEGQRLFIWITKTPKVFQDKLRQPVVS